MLTQVGLARARDAFDGAGAAKKKSKKRKSTCRRRTKPKKRHSKKKRSSRRCYRTRRMSAEAVDHDVLAEFQPGSAKAKAADVDVEAAGSAKAFSRVGSKLDVWRRTAHHTSGGLTRSKLMRNSKSGKIVSKKKHAQGKRLRALALKAGYFTKKGTFGLFKKTASGSVRKVCTRRRR